MAPEISIDKVMKSASIEQWVFALTTFIILNPDQDYPYQMNIELLKKESDETDLLALRNKCLTNNGYPISSMKYQVIKETQYPHIKETVLNSIKFDWQDRATINYIFREMKEEKPIYCYPLSVSQPTALEKIDKEIITRSNSEGPDFELSPPKTMEQTHVLLFPLE